ncbi:MAG: DUF6067 family protein [Candidatus Hydrogenedentota bacterium]
MPLASFLSVLICATSPAQPPIAPEVAAKFTILQNGGFEEGAEMPAWWSRHPAENNDRNLHARDTRTAYSGQASALIEWLDPIAGPNKAPLQWSKYGLPVKGGTELIFSGFVKVEGAPECHVGIHFYDAEKTHLGFQSVPHPENPRDWTYFEGYVPVPSGAATMGAVLYSRMGGKTWYDDVALLGTPALKATRGTPTINGILDDPCWTDANLVDDFIDHAGTGTAARPVRAWIAYDDTAVYVAFDCPAQGNFENEWVTVYLEPNHAHTEHFVLRLKENGSLDTAKCSAARAPGSGEQPWLCEANTAVTQSNTCWRAEIAIPLESLDLGPDTKSAWGLQLARYDVASDQIVSWSVSRDLGNPGRFGNVAIAPHLTPFLRSALQREAETAAKDRVSLEQEFRSVNLTPDTAPEVYALLKRAAENESRMAAAGDSRQPLTAESARAWITNHATMLREARSKGLDAHYSGATACGDAPFAVLVAGTLQKVPRTGPVNHGTFATAVALSAARDESESFQLVVVPRNAELSNISVDAPPLSGPGAPLPVSWRRVDYVETGQPKRYEPEHVGWWPDVLMPPGAFNVSQNRRQPLWFTVSVPPDAAQGIYKGEVTIRADGHAVSMPVSLRVHNFRLPRPGTLAAPFGLYARALSNWYFGTGDYAKVLSPETFAEWCAFMGEYRLTPKNIANEYWKRTEKEGNVEFDLSTTRDIVTPLTSQYFPPYSFCVYRLPCPADVRDGTTKADPNVWIRDLAARVDAYKAMGLPEEAYVYGIDEPSPKAYEFVRGVYEMARTAAPGFPIMQTVNHTPPRELADLVDIWCPLSRSAGDPFYQERRKAGDTLWTYVCCSPPPPYANFFIDQPAIDHRMVFWQARQVGATGVLYWCVAWWNGIPGPSGNTPYFPEVPIVLKDNADTLTHLGVNGDGALIWPGPDMTPYPSIRLEIVRDGIEDYEYFSLLERLLEQVKALPEDVRPAPDLLVRASQLLIVPEFISASMTDFTKDPETLLSHRAALAEMIESLTNALAH